MEAAPLMFHKTSLTMSIRSAVCCLFLPSAMWGQTFVSHQPDARPTLANIKLDDLPRFGTPTPAPVLASTRGEIFVPIGTPIQLQLDKTISSARAKRGDRLDFIVSKNVEVGGFTVIEATSVASGSVVSVKRTRMLGIGGKLVIQLDSVNLVTGEPLGLTASRMVKGSSRTKLMLAEMLATGLSYLPAAPVFLLSHGIDSTLLKGMEVTAHTSSNVTLPTANLVAAKGERSELSQLIHFLPPRAVDAQGRDGDMLNLAFVARQSELEEAFARSGWVKTEKTKFPAFWHLAIQRMHYAKLPMRALYVFGRTQDYSYALPDSKSVVAKRHHIRIWKTDYSVDGTTIWVGAATYDVALQWQFRKLRVFHRIDPKIDAERDFIAGRLAETNLVSRQEYLSCTSPVFKGETATGGAYYSDSRMLLVELDSQRLKSEPSLVANPQSSPEPLEKSITPAAAMLNATR